MIYWKSKWDRRDRATEPVPDNACEVAQPGVTVNRLDGGITNRTAVKYSTMTRRKPKIHRDGKRMIRNESGGQFHGRAERPDQTKPFTNANSMLNRDLRRVRVFFFAYRNRKYCSMLCCVEFRGSSLSMVSKGKLFIILSILECMNMV